MKLGAVFIVFFGLYLYSCGPTLVPYRDAGEMATSVYTLGIHHPPSYPLYALSGHLFSQLPLGNPGYRTNVFSGFMMAGAWALFFLLIADFVGDSVAGVTILLAGLSYQFWAHALVAEMYALNIFFLCAILLALRHEKRYLAALLFGIGLANRIDLVLCVPAFLCLISISNSTKRDYVKLLILSVCGLALYLYLPLRASQHPFLNWNDPSTMDQFIGSLLRRGYGGTLDLLSKSYGMGENFLPEFVLYLKHVIRDFAFISVLLIPLGMANLWRISKPWAWSILLGWAITGPLFIFLGNLPPNPHAVAIMESAYLVPDIFLLVLMGIGLSRLPKIALPGAAILIAFFSVRTYADVLKRDNYLADDFIRNVYHSVPPGSLIVARSDVPVFSLFYGHWIAPRSPDRIPLGQGLLHSGWYQDMMGRQVPGIELSALSTAADWTAMATANRAWSLFATNDMDWPPEGTMEFELWGLVNRFAGPGSRVIPQSQAADAFLGALSIQRGLYRYDAYRDFFSSELVEEYAKAWTQMGERRAKQGANVSAQEALRHAVSLKRDMPYPIFQLAYLSFSNQSFSDALRYYDWSVSVFEEVQRQARDWKSFEGVRESLNHDEASALAQEGVAEERVGRNDLAEKLFMRAIDLDSTCADAHYNLAVLYWNQARWPQVVEQLESMAKTNPEDARWKRYLPAAMAHIK